VESGRLEVALVLLLALVAAAPLHFLLRWLALVALTVWAGVTTLSSLPPPSGRAERPEASWNRLEVLTGVVRSALEGAAQSRRILAEELADLVREAGLPAGDVERARRDLAEGDLASALEAWLSRVRAPSRYRGSVGGVADGG